MAVHIYAVHTYIPTTTLAIHQDAGFAPAVAFQTVAAEGISGLLCAQLQALVETALRPLARYAIAIVFYTCILFLFLFLFIYFCLHMYVY